MWWNRTRRYGRCMCVSLMLREDLMASCILSTYDSKWHSQNECIGCCWYICFFMFILYESSLTKIAKHLIFGRDKTWTIPRQRRHFVDLALSIYMYASNESEWDIKRYFAFDYPKHGNFLFRYIFFVPLVAWEVDKALTNVYIRRGATASEHFN